MKLSVKGLTLAAAIIWGFGFLFVAAVDLLWFPYGGAFLEVMSSVYPGYKATASLDSVVVGTLYALVDGAIGGALFAWVYNCFAK
jgi:hypothetical protein